MSALVVTTLCEQAGSRLWRSCGKLWVASLLRHLWDGRILLCRNFEEPLFAVERASVKEETYPVERVVPDKELGALRRLARERQTLGWMEEDLEELEWVVLADADCVALRNLDHLFTRREDVLVSRGPAGPDPGFVAIRAARAVEFAGRLEELGGLAAEPLAAMIAEDGWKVGEFERGEVLRPGDPGVTLEDLANAAVVHFSGMKPEDKQRLAFALHMMAVYGDKDGLFFDMLEA